MKDKKHMIWIDLEMTGLWPERDRIIEIASVVTDLNLEIVAEGPVVAIHQEPAVLASMDAWNTKQHHRTGLIKRVQESQIKEAEAECLTLDFLKRHVVEGKSPMCGNSICQDRRFLCRFMPKLAAFFHYRNLDVSTLKELAARWKPDLLKGFKKESKHMAMDDIKESIAELAYYREHFIKG